MAGAPRYPRGATVVRDVRIGQGVDAPDEYDLTIVRAAIRTTSGEFWIVSRTAVLGGESFVRRYDSTGKHIRLVGREGDGPGEYRIPESLAELRDGRVVLRDASVINRLTVFNRDGSYDTTWTLATPLSGGNLFAVDTSGFLWVEFRTAFGSALSRFARLTSRGVIVDTIDAPPLAVVRRDPSVHARTSRGEIGYSPPFQPAAMRAWSPSGFFALTVTDRYAVDLHIARPNRGRPAFAWRAGDPVMSVRREVPPVEVTDSERSYRLAELEQQIKRWNGRSTTRIPEIRRRKPPIGGAQFSDDGTLWVRVSLPSERVAVETKARASGTPPLEWRDPVAYDVFQPDGAYLGRVRFPPEVGARGIHRFRGPLVWFILTDEDQIQYVQAYRVIWNP